MAFRPREIVLSALLLVCLLVGIHFAVQATSTAASGRDVIRVTAHYDNAN